MDSRLGRATSRLLTNEQNIIKEKELSKKLGKVPPEESVKIPQIGEWSLSLSKTATTSVKQLPSPPIRSPKTQKIKTSEQFVGPVYQPRIHIPKSRNAAGQINPIERVSFPAGTTTTDLNDILKSRTINPIKPIPPLNQDENLQEPQFVPSDMFDDSSYEEFPLEVLMKDPVGYSRYQDLDGHIFWSKCKVIEYDEEKHLFLIEWMSTGRRKYVSRFNLRFERENQELFNKRVAAAKRGAALYEASVRYQVRIDTMPRNNLPELSPENIQSIFEKINLPDNYKRSAEIKQKLIHEICEEFKTVNNQLEFERELEYNELIPNREEFFAVLSQKPPPPKLELVPHGDSNYEENKKRLTEFLLFAYPVFQRAIYQIWAIFDHSSNFRLLTNGFDELLILEDYISKQFTKLATVSSNLKTSIQNTLEASISQTFGEKLSAKERAMSDQLATLTTRMLHTVLYIIISESMNDFMSSFEKYINDKSAEPQISVNLVLSEDKLITLDPTIEKSREEILGLTQQLESTAQDMLNIKSAMFEVDTSSVSFQDCCELIQHRYEPFTNIIDTLYSQTKRFITDHEFLAPVLGLDPNEYAVSFDPSGKKSLEEYRHQLGEFTKVLNAIQGMEDSYNVNFFKIMCTDFKQKSIVHCNNLMFNFLDHINKFVLSDLDNLNKEYNEITVELKKIPTTPESLAEMKKYMVKIYDTAQQKTDMITQIKNRFAFLEEFQYEISNEEIEFWYKIRQMPTKISVMLDETERILSIERIKMIRELKVNQKKLEDEALDLSEKVMMFAQKYNDLDMTVEAVDLVNEMEKQLQDMQKEQETYNRHEKLFSFEQGSNKVLQKLQQEFTPLHTLWNLASDWSTTKTSWLDTSFTQIKPDQINQFIILGTKKVNKLRKDLADQHFLVDRVLNPLSENIDEFKKNVPLIMKLRHPGIKTKHWEEISKVVGFNAAPDLELTLQGFLDLHFEKWMEPVTAIANVAAQEYTLETSLDQMDGELQTKKFVTSEFRDSGQYILNEIDDIVSTIDDQLVTTQTILASPFIEPVKKRALDRLNFLHLSEKIINKWISCQKNWLYLQPIFTGTSIQQKLVKEARDWKNVEGIWNSVMNATHSHPEFQTVMTRDNLYEQLYECNRLLDFINVGLNKYLEAKRMGFPRFFFLSNDELITILSHSKDIKKVQESLSKLFEYVSTVTMDGNDIVSMNDSEGEEVKLFNPVNFDTPEIEDWLNNFEEEMKHSINQYIEQANSSLKKLNREEWIVNYPAQVILITNQINWTQQVTQVLNGQKLRAMKVLLQKFIEQLEGLTSLVRKPINHLTRQVLSCLLILEVHNRDIIKDFVQNEVTDLESFKWLQQLRYYWEDQTVIVRSINNTFEYSYEYAGNSTRLVITPLTDRCYQTLLCAFRMFLSGAPSGPAGTGKTETVRDCAKALGRSCVVYNCSEEVTPEQMSQFFAGLSSSGSWSCFDEFNRINIEVLSVIAQQVRTIQDAIAENLQTFQLDKRQLKINHNAAICITMNPGYAGRTELPDNLKALFRPCAMMVPDFIFISEILLFSGGFTTASSLAVKLVALFDLCRKQLSNSHHYDWGLRAMKAILSTAGKAKRNDLEANESLLLVRTIRDCTVPKLISDDIPLFNGILSDVFPNVEYNKPMSDEFITSIKYSLKSINEQPLDATIAKTVELYETTLVRHGIMLVGGAMGGKSTAWRSLSLALTNMSQNSNTYKPIQIETLNPKAISIAELYGAFNPVTSEWADGVLSKIIREMTFSDQSVGKWIIVDGPVDSLWIESMNSLLDDNKVLCLPNNERIQLGPHVKMMFEVDNLDEASPATVSRCGMVYFDPCVLQWNALADSWRDSLVEKQPAVANYVRELMNSWIRNTLTFISNDAKTSIKINPNFCVRSLLNLLNSFLDVLRQPVESSTDGEETVMTDPLDTSKYFSVFHQGSDSIPYFESEQSTLIFEKIFVFCVIWAFGGALDEDSRLLFDKFVRDLLETTQSRVQFPPKGLIYDYYIDLAQFTWLPWMDGQTNQKITEDLPIEQQLVPTKESAVTIFLSRLLCSKGYHVLLQGPETSKTLSIKTMFSKVLSPAKYDTHFFPLASCSTPNGISKYMHAFMHKRQGKLGPLPNQQLIYLLDNINAVQPEVYGAQPPLELLRQFMDYNGWYQTSPVEFQEITGTSLIATMGVPGGGLYNIPERLLSHFFILHSPAYNVIETSQIVEGLMMNAFGKYSQSIVERLKPISNAMVGIYAECQKSLLAIPSKLHYIFNMRNIIHVIKGMLLIKPENIPTEIQFMRLWQHEMMREFHDRFNTNSDRKWLIAALKQQIEEGMHGKVDREPMFCSFSDNTKLYKEVNVSQEQLIQICNNLLEEHNREVQKQLDIVLFPEAISHLASLSRAFSLERGHAMLVGVKSSGRKSLAHLALYACSMEPFEISITRTYNFEEWRENLKTLMHQCGVEDRPTGFIISDVQIIMPQQLEDISNILTSSEVPQLYDRDEIEAIKQEINKDDTAADNIPAWDKFMLRVKKNLHVILVFSPYGQTFKDVMLSFTNIRNEVIIDWYMPWLNESLVSIGLTALQKANIPSNIINNVIKIMVDIHKSAEDFASKFIKETKRYNAVTPSRFFELLQTFTERLINGQNSNQSSIKDYTQGIEKIKSTQAQIATMREQLDRDIPILQKTEKEVNEMLKELSVKSAECENTQKEVKEQSDVAEKEAQQATEANRVAQEQFAKAEPILEEARIAVSKLDKDSLVNIKKLHNPTSGMKDTFDAVCIMFERQPRKVDGPTPGTKEEDYWPEAVSLLNDIKFINNITNFKIENMKQQTINKLKKYVPTDPAAREEKKKAAQQSFAAVGAFYDWVCASFDYWNVYQEILPLKNAADEASKKLEASQAILHKAKQHLAQVEQTLKDLQDKVDAMKQRETELKENVQKTTARLDRANKIMSGLAGETDRWTEVSSSLENSSKYIMGDSILISGVLTYLGVYSPSYRTNILKTWQGFLNDNGIVFTNNFSIISSLGNDATIRDWITKGLSNDSHSIQNALIITKNPESFPLLIDPQLNGTTWLRAIDEKLVALRFDQVDFLQRLKSCIQIGIPVIVENVGLKIDPIIDPILSKEIMNVDGAKTISIGGEVVNYNDNFRLYLSTKYPNPQYSPAICSQVTLINFTTTEEGLTDLLLNNLIEVERADLDEKRVQIMEASALAIRRLKEIEKEILNIVSNAGSDILDDDKAITTLHNAHETSQSIAQQMAASEITQKQITEFRNQFFQVASRAALLYFCVSDFSVIDSMYQFSLKWFTNLFRNAIINAQHFQNVDETIKSFNNTIARNFYESVSYSLFSRHKLLFSSLMCIRILHSEKKISSSELAFLLSPNVEQLTSPLLFITDESWRQAAALEKISSDFNNLTKHIQENSDKWREYMENQTAETATIPFGQGKLSSFQKFLLLKIFHLERVREGLHIFIEENLGKEFVTPPTLNLTKVFKESNTTTPLIFIIMPGIDPQDEILGVTASMEMEKYVRAYSLGRGRGQGAEELIREAAESGFIVVLQNCHLSLSWMPKLEHILNELSMEPDKLNPRFRVCLVTMSDPNFPIGILYQGTKLIYEIPRGIRENIMRIYSGFNADEYESDSSEIEKQLTFNLAFFHSVVLERLQFGSMGWNIPYEFNPSDFAISRKQLHTFLTESGNNQNDIPFEALGYVIGELNYGGRVTDAWDRRLLLSVLQRYFSEESTSQGFTFGKRYNSPSSFDIPLPDIIKVLEGWPTVTASQDVGLSLNASTIVARNEAMNIFNKLIEVQPTLVSSSESVSEEQFALSLVTSLQQVLPRPFNIFNFKKKFTQKDTIATVLYHEIVLYNELIQTIAESLKKIERGLKGLILIDSQLETLKKRLLSNRVPEIWLSKSFPSILTLRNYMDDLRQRVDFIDNWIRMGTPVVYRLGAFFHPEEFLTAVLQVYARTKVVPFDTLSWKTTPINTIINESPSEGIYIEGLPLEGAKWDNFQGTLVECSQMELDNKLPVFHLVPTEQPSQYDRSKFYECPVFRTQSRGTGALDLPNYILSLFLPSKVSPDHWIQRSVAAFITVQ